MQAWWRTNGENWVRQFRFVIVEHRGISQDWQWSEPQLEMLQQYCRANQFLVDCLNSEDQVSDAVRMEIEETLLLPLTTIISGCSTDLI
ncbi:hypothetical protein IQ257_19060 [Coleofasciculus sp. LEGE 07092]|uniref:NACHT C-terminal helical domain 2-containing protein n=1 Tax=Coleofasciculus sp. LEGE 07081 TaxID=2777967 RepID=UPI00187DF3A9|nr:MULTISPECIES: hypothetical protein [unclassified Coleofasciculus]MBE9127290.1 hypothetical protein [Coleofasciculus sp. LEGE 07081]MBE9150558.1 hypothetical protein [Coleofasciculus sp. LEGE 07092]